jgi:hypothetical protein
MIIGVHGSSVDRGTVLQAEKSRVLFPMEFFIDVNPPATL